MELAFKKQLTELRKDAGISQEELVNKLFVSRQAISKWELGESVPDLIKVSEIAQYFNVSLDELVWGVSPPEKKLEPQSGAQAEASQVAKEQSQSSRRQQSEETKIQHFYEFFGRYWWVVFPIGGFLSWFIPHIIEAIQ